ncbi:MAG: hypothetical protein ACRCX8_19675 [Sarcina sp.]
MKRKIMVLQNFSINGERFCKGSIADMNVDLIDKYKKDGLIEEVSVALGLDTPIVDLSNYAKKSHSHTSYTTDDELKQYKVEVQTMIDSLVDRISELEKQLEKHNTLSDTLSTDKNVKKSTAKSTKTKA